MLLLSDAVVDLMPGALLQLKVFYLLLSVDLTGVVNARFGVQMLLQLELDGFSDDVAVNLEGLF